MHDGSIATLEDVIEFYDRGGNDNPFRDQELRPLRLTEEEKKALVAFLPPWPTLWWRSDAWGITRTIPW